jgi:hypothetical protein
MDDNEIIIPTPEDQIQLQKEEQWLLKKVGKFSASHADDLMSKSGTWTVGNINYLYDIQDQRTTQEPPPHVEARPMKIGTENEPYAVMWLRENYPELHILHCDVDFTEKIFDEPWPDVMFGVSPDAFVMSAPQSEDWDHVYNDHIKSQIAELIEIKCVVGRTQTARYFSPTLPFSTKRLMAFEEHGMQMAAQLLAYPNVQKIRLLKYRPQLDENQYDRRPVTDPTRGVMFEFTREEFASDMIKFEARARFADAYLKSGQDLEKINGLKLLKK